MKISNGEKRDWSLLIFIVPVGIFLMMIAGQIAVRIIPSWSVYAGMQSSLDPQTASKQQAEVQPILPGILTPLSWFDTFLTPNSNSDGNVAFPPFIVFEASATPTSSPIPSSTTTETAVGTSTVTSSPPATTSTPIATSTKKPPAEDTSTPPPPAMCTDPAANNIGSPLPCTYTPVSSPLVGSAASVPGNTNIGAPDNLVGNVTDGRFVIINLSPFLQVNGPTDTGYDLVYYELYRPLPNNDIAMDSVILSISSDGTIYYVVFNWGDGTPDANSNIGDVAATSGTENDNQSIPVSELYGTPTLQTGVLIDVDNAPSHPPAGSYLYLAIQAPVAPINDGNDGADVNSVQVLP